MCDSVIQAFVTEQRELLSLELQAETDEQETVENDEHAAHVLGNLEATDVSVGLYGRTVVELTLWTEKTDSKKDPILPAHRLTVGDEVEIRSKHASSKKIPSGVVSVVSDSSISIALFQKPTQSSNGTSSDHLQGDEEIDDAGFGLPPLTVVPRSSADVHRKLLHGLGTLEKKGVDHPIAGRVIRAMFSVDPTIDAMAACEVQSRPDDTVFNQNLDDSQRNAISFALHKDRPVSLIHGPPGTGKTTTVAELIKQAVQVHGMKVLVAAPSNVAVDNVLERLAETHQPDSKALKGAKSRSKRKKLKGSALRMVRLGHPARIKPSTQSFSLEAMVQASDGTEIVADVRRELNSFLRILSNPKARAPDKRVAYREIKVLRKEVRSREEKVVRELIESAQVVLATTVGAANRILDNIVDGFDLVVIDEAAQALEASCWIPILRGKKAILCGDHCQLPPTIKSKNRKAQTGLGRTMFERLMHLYGDAEPGQQGGHKISRMLNVQYRMNHNIADWASEAMYHGELQTHPSVRDRTISDLVEVPQEKMQDELLTSALLLIDTAGCGMSETVNAAGSRFNDGEARIVSQHVRKLIDVGLDQRQICIITPYNGQVELLRNLLLVDFPKLEIRSVDGFQGGERDAVILSLVRSSDQGGRQGIGFLKDDRRQNVAVTRARRHLAVVCDSETVSQSKFIQTLIQWIENHGEQQSAMEYLSESPNQADELDLLNVENDLMGLVEAQPTKKDAKPRVDQNQDRPSDDKTNRKKLIDMVAAFAESAVAGDEMKLSKELSSFDRRVVHEFAEQIGLLHSSEGVEGKDRRIVLSIPKSIGPKKEEAMPSVEDTSSEFAATTSNFEMLQVDSDNSDSEENEEEGSRSMAPQEDGKVEPAAGNSLLAQLAKEREERKTQQKEQMGLSTKSTPNRKKSRGKKLGGSKKPRKVEKDEGLDDLDDLAFLDAQIEKVQNAHGRKVEGRGKQYRTIVNGILNARPESRTTPTNTRASGALHAKLKEAQNARKAKGSKKKKR